MFLIRGLVFTHEAVRDWKAKLAPRLAEGLRKRRAGKAGRCWHVDETYVKVAGEWCYLYRAIDRDGNLVDVYLSETRDLAAAKAFLRSARSVTEVEPEQVTTDGYTSYPKAIAEECCATIKTGHPATICHTSDGGAVSGGQAGVKPEAASGGSPKG
jgi:putative transposase